MKTIRWGILGCGAVTEEKSGPAFQKVENSSLVAVMRRTGFLAQDYAERHRAPKWYDDADALINDPEIDAVYIATPPDAHEPYTLKCAEAGKPVYVEKPMARTHAECLSMIEACQKAKVPLFVAYYRRALPRFLKIKEFIDEGLIGKLRTVHIALHQPPTPVVPNDLPWRVVPEIAGGGLFFDLGCHMLDFLDFVIGPIVSVNGFAANQGSPYAAEDIVTANFVFENGILGTGSWCFTSYKRVDQIDIIGTSGQISFSVFGTGPLVLMTQSGDTRILIDHPEHVQQPLIETVVNSILNETDACPSTGESAARTSWVLDEIIKGYRASTQQKLFKRNDAKVPRT